MLALPTLIVAALLLFATKTPLLSSLHHFSASCNAHPIHQLSWHLLFDVMFQRKVIFFDL